MLKSSICILITVLLLFFCHHSVAVAQSSKHYHILVRAYTGKQQSMHRWEPTRQYLESQIPHTRFTLVPFTDFGHAEQLVKQKKVDFIISDPLFYSQIENQYGVTRVATLTLKSGGIYLTKYGGVVFTHVDNQQINSFASLKDKHFLAVAPRGFAGWLCAKREIQKAGLHPESLFRKLEFTDGRGDIVVKKVFNKEVDAGTVRTGLLERMAKKGIIDLSRIKIINPINSEFFPLHRSTPLYPEFAFSKQAHVPIEDGVAVLQALLKITENDNAAEKGRYARWSVPEEYSSLIALMKDLSIPPYADFNKITIRKIIHKYMGQLVIIFLSIVILIFLLLKLKRLNATLELRVKDGIEKHAQQESLIVQQAKMAALGVMLGGIAHQWKQPINVISINAQLIDNELSSSGLPADDLKQYTNNINNQIEFMTSTMKEFTRFFMPSKTKTVFEPCTAFNEIINLFGHQFSSNNISVQLDKCAPCKTFGYQNEFKQVVLNLLNNARDAILAAHNKKGTINITFENRKDSFYCYIKDNGIGIPEDLLPDKLFNPYMSTKGNDGMGLGLYLCQKIIHKMNGELTAANHSGGAVFTITLKRAETTPKLDFNERHTL